MYYFFSKRTIDSHTYLRIWSNFQKKRKVGSNLFIFFMTTIFASILLTAMLKVLHLFDFITWSAVQLIAPLKLADAHWIARWFGIFLVVFIVVCIVYGLATVIPLPIVSALVVGVIITYLLEWRLHESFTWRSISIPLLVVIALTSHFVFVTARFHHKIKLRSSK